MSTYRVTINEWNRPDADEVEIECDAPLPEKITVGDKIEFTVVAVKRIHVERLPKPDRHEAFPDG